VAGDGGELLRLSTQEEINPPNVVHDLLTERSWVPIGDNVRQARGIGAQPAG
jgi:hypothetical protein